MLYIIADMNTNKSVRDLAMEIVEIKQKLLALGPMHPGSVSQQYQVCGNPTCRCMHPKHPLRHGPYYKLAYVYRGHPVCRFVRAASVANMKQRLATYKVFRKLIDRWVWLSIQQGLSEFFSKTTNNPVRKPN